MTRTYSRSEIVSYYDLTEAQQSEVIDTYYDTAAEADEDSYVILEDSPLPLSMFMRTDKNNFTHGIYSTSAFDGYFITLAKSGDCATVAHKHF